MEIFVANIILALSGLTLARLDLAKICQNNNLDDVIHNPEDCSSYIVCGYRPSIHYCEAGLHYDAKRRVCNWPEYAGCKIGQQPSHTDEDEKKEEIIIAPPHPEIMEEEKRHYSPFVAIDVMTGETIDPMSDYDAHQVVCRHFGAYFLPHPRHCRSYFLCAYGYIHEHSCGLGTMWNYKKKQCEISSKAECYHKTREEEKESSSSLTATTDNPLMVCYTLAPTTTDGLPTNTNTWHPTGSIHNATKTTAESTTPMSSSSWTGYTPTPQYSGSSQSSTTATSTAAPSKTPNSSGSIILECPTKKQSYIAHPKDCSKYYMCIMGMPVLTSCPVGLFWDTKMEYCDVAKNVKCFQ